MTIIYIRGEDNTVADALSHLPPDTDEGDRTSSQPHEQWMQHKLLNTVLLITTNKTILKDIVKGYSQDKFCKQLPTAGMKAMKQ